MKNIQSTQGDVGQEHSSGERIESLVSQEQGLVSHEPLPILNLEFTCDAYSIRISAEASTAAVNFAIAALETFKTSYFADGKGGDAQ